MSGKKRASAPTWDDEELDDCVILEPGAAGREVGLDADIFVDVPVAGISDAIMFPATDFRCSICGLRYANVASFPCGHICKFHSALFFCHTQPSASCAQLGTA